MVKVIRVLTWFFLLHFAACSTTDYYFGNEPKIVLTAFLSNTRSVEVYLSKSYKNYTAPEPILNGQVVLYENGVQKATLYHDNFGRYLTNYVPVANYEYKIIATVPGMGMASGKVTLPPMVVFKNKKDYDIQLIFLDTIIPETGSHIIDTFYQRKFEITYTDLPEAGNVYQYSARELYTFVYGGKESVFNTLVYGFGAFLSPNEYYNGSPWICHNYNFIYDSLYNASDITISSVFTMEYPAEEKAKSIMFI